MKLPQLLRGMFFLPQRSDCNKSVEDGVVGRSHFGSRTETDFAGSSLSVSVNPQESYRSEFYYYEFIFPERFYLLRAELSDRNSKNFFSRGLLPIIKLIISRHQV